MTSQYITEFSEFFTKNSLIYIDKIQNKTLFLSSKLKCMQLVTSVESIRVFIIVLPIIEYSLRDLNALILQCYNAIFSC